MLTNKDDALISKFFATNGSHQRSSFHPMMESAKGRSPADRPKEATVRRKRVDVHPGHCLCPRCRENEITARPTAEQHETGKDGPDDALLVIMGHVSKRLELMKRFSPRSHEVLEAFYGDVGAKCGRTNHGTLAALYRFTTAGKKLLAREQKKARAAAKKVDDQQRLANALESADVTNGALVGKCRMEAQAIYVKACEDWNSTAPAKPGVR